MKQFSLQKIHLFITVLITVHVDGAQLHVRIELSQFTLAQHTGEERKKWTEFRCLYSNSNNNRICGYFGVHVFSFLLSIVYFVSIYLVNVLYHERNKKWHCLKTMYNFDHIGHGYYCRRRRRRANAHISYFFLLSVLERVPPSALVWTVCDCMFFLLLLRFVLCKHIVFAKTNDNIVI